MRRSRLHLVRHGEVEPDWHGRIYGGLDVPLCDAGRQRFERLAEELAHLRLAAVYSSDLRRALDGAERVARRLGLEVRVEPRLREIDRGAWVGLAVDELDRHWPGATDAYLTDPDGYRAHGGESHAMLADRVWPALEAIAGSHVDSEVLIVGHGQVMRAVVARILGIPGHLSLNLMTTYGGITTIDRYADGVWVVQAVNAPAVRPGEWGGRTFKP
jgi:broad specificity phosphatase PhoE